MLELLCSSSAFFGCWILFLNRAHLISFCRVTNRLAVPANWQGKIRINFLPDALEYDVSNGGEFTN